MERTCFLNTSVKCSDHWVGMHQQLCLLSNLDTASKDWSQVMIFNSLLLSCLLWAFCNGDTTHWSEFTFLPVLYFSPLLVVCWRFFGEPNGESCITCPMQLLNFHLSLFSTFVSLIASDLSARSGLLLPHSVYTLWGIVLLQLRLCLKHVSDITAHRT